MEIVRKEDIVFSSLRSSNLERILLSIATILASFSPGQPGLLWGLRKALLLIYPVVAYKPAIGKECGFFSLRRNFLCTGKKKGSETVLRLILSEKNRFPMEKIHQIFISEVKMLLFTGNI